MPPIKLSKVSIPPRPRPAPPAGAPSPVAGAAPAPTVQDDPTILTDPGLDPATPDAVGDSIGDAPGFAAARAVTTPGPTADEGTVNVPTALIEQLWRAVDTVPGLTVDAALTLALTQFLAALPDDDSWS